VLLLLTEFPVGQTAGILFPNNTTILLTEDLTYQKLLKSVDF